MNKSKVLILLAASSVTLSAQKKPNLVFVFSDQHRKHALGFMGEDPVITPNIDKFANEAIVFNNMVSNTPVCTPYRSMLLTGRHPNYTGMTKNSADGAKGLELADTIPGFGDALKKNGYSTGYIGKWHLSDPAHFGSAFCGYNLDEGRGWDAWTPPAYRKGFDFWHAYNSYPDHMNPHYYGDSYAKADRVEPKDWSVKHETDVAIDFIKANKDTSFALFVSYLPPHGPFDRYPGWLDGYYKDDSIQSLLTRKNANPKMGDAWKVIPYMKAITGIDYHFQRILDNLKEMGLAENTIVVFTADHGEMMTSHGKMDKTIYYEESTGIPFIVRWPGKIETKRTDVIFGVLDYMPSLLGLMNLKCDFPLDGEDKSWAIKGAQKDANGNRPYSTFIASYQGSKLLSSNNNEKWQISGGYRGVKTERYTYVFTRSSSTFEKDEFLFDNLKDKYQMNKIYPTNNEYKAVFDTLRNELKYWMDKTDDPYLEYNDTTTNIVYGGLIINGNFEATPWDNAWEKIGEINPQTDERAIEGTTARMTGNSDARTLKQTIKVEPGETYQLSFTGRIHNGIGASGENQNTDNQALSAFYQGPSDNEPILLHDLRSNVDSRVVVDFTVNKIDTTTTISFSKPMYIAFLDNIWVEKLIDNSTSEIYHHKNVTIAPNPNNGRFQIDCKQPITKVSIFDVNGQMVACKFPIDKTLDFSHLNNGVFLLEIETLENVFAKKIIIIK
jgi:arylsulfatase A-like enzyme